MPFLLPANRANPWEAISVNAQTNRQGLNPPASSIVIGGLEKDEVSLGFIPLTDCAPLVIALEKGFFKDFGLRATLSREPSWANIRDKVCFGLLDGAHMLAGMPLAASLGAEAFRVPMVTGFSMGLNGNAITVSNRLYRRLMETGIPLQSPATANALKKLIMEDKAKGMKPMRFAMVYPSSSHNYLLRYWLASAGIDPDRDIRLTVVPPPQMADCLRTGSVDGYCVGEPWNARAVEEGIGRVLINSGEIWNNHPEKVFGVTREWAEAYPNTHKAILMALLLATRWLDQAENRAEAVELLARPEYVDAPPSALAAGLLGRFTYGQGEAPKVQPDFHVFHRYAANFPWASHAEWILTQMQRWGQLRGSMDIKLAAASVYRPELYRQAASALGLTYPPFDRKQEGLHGTPWLLATQTDSFMLGADRFFDGGVFDCSEYRPSQMSLHPTTKQSVFS
ncbi:MAG: nitrate ABC transporter [Candidatus Methylumidiphilus alinenensis]|uniref:Nitrate ABC transporter n=1 Tax=Candidatus Methylumidiphilus alinenensis TaxID=2202197 RepID=A0A2W4QV69_9GAMM|nr:MAG: nitrate ABC transporter [Candidatus Methylumidiphilus alinenensis]